MKEFYQFWSDLGWLANLLGICLVVFPLAAFFVKAANYARDIKKGYS